MNNLSNAMLEIGSLEADARNKHDNYDYISADKILERVGKVLGDLDTVVIPGVENVEIREYTYQQNKTMYSAVVYMTMEIHTGDKVHTTQWAGCGVDYRVPDKAVYKAITSGHKYFLTKLLMIGIGNEDSEHQSAPRDTKQQPQVEDTPPQGRRPYEPEETRASILVAQNHYEENPKGVTEGLRGLVVGTMNNLFPGDGDTERHAITNWVFDVSSSKELTDPQVLALKRWLEPIEDGIPSQLAIAEARKIIRKIGKDQGQQELM